MTIVAAWSTQDAREVFSAIAAVGAGILAVVAVYRLPLVSRPLRWLARTLVADPLTGFFHRVLDSWWAGSPQAERLESIGAEFRNNGGSSLRDSVDRVEKGLVEHTDQDAQNFAAIEDRMVRIEEAVCDGPAPDP